MSGDRSYSVIVQNVRKMLLAEELYKNIMVHACLLILFYAYVVLTFKNQFIGIDLKKVI